MSPEQVQGQGAGRSSRRSVGARLHGLRVPHRAHRLVDRAGRRDDVRADRERAAAPTRCFSAPICPITFRAWFERALAAIARRPLPDRERARRRARHRARRPRARVIRSSLADGVEPTPSRPRADQREPSGRGAPADSRQGWAGFEPSPASESHRNRGPPGFARRQRVGQPPLSRPSGTSPLSSTLDRAEGRGLSQAQAGAVGAPSSRCSAWRDHRGGYLGWLFLIRPAACPRRDARHCQSSSAPERRGFTAMRPRPKGPNGLRWWRARRFSSASNNFPDAVARVQRSLGLASGSGAPRLFFEQAQVAASAKGPCKVTGISRPRPFGLNRSGRAPLAGIHPARRAWSRGPTTTSPRGTTTPTQCSSIRRCAPRARPAT